MELEFERELIEDPPDEDGTTDEVIEFLSTKFGPLLAARSVTQADGRWPALRNDLVGFLEEDEPAEYLVVLGRKASAAR